MSETYKEDVKIISIVKLSYYGIFYVWISDNYEFFQKRADRIAIVGIVIICYKKMVLLWGNVYNVILWRDNEVGNFL